MKLYTEEQVRKAIKLAQECEHECGGVYFDYTETEVLDELTPIELPSDEEVTKKSLQYSQWFDLHKSFYKGAKWMLEYIIIKNR